MVFFLARVLTLLLLVPLAAPLHAAVLASPEEPNITRPGHRFFRFPVTWELMRSGFNSLDVALEAESYAEYWAILYISPDEIDLLTPRGRTRVVGIASSPDTPAGYPDTLVVNESDLARLLGLEADPSAPVEQVLFISLPIQENGYGHGNFLSGVETDLGQGLQVHVHGLNDFLVVSLDGKMQMTAASDGGKKTTLSK